MTLPAGRYRTAAGSKLVVSGQHGGVVAMWFDWLEEGGCVDCVPEPYDADGYLVWHCDQHEGGKARWEAQ